MIVMNPTLEKSVSIFDGSELIDKAYDGLIAMMDIIPDAGGEIEGYQISSGKENVWTHYNAIIDGIYIPGSERVYWHGTFDIGVDDFPDKGCVYCQPLKGEQFRYCTIEKIDKFPKYIFCSCSDPAARYRVVVTVINEDKKIYPVIVFESFFAVDKKGRVGSAIDVNYKRAYAGTSEAYHGCKYGAGALSLLADRKYLWNVCAIESFEKYDLKINFGINEDHIKSLLYARDAPLTLSGRKRPILHWVDQHKRRIKEGVDIDINKYLRGITEFNLGNLSFQIDNPKKISKNKAA